MGLPKGETTAQGRASRDAILDSATAEFTESGFRAASLRRIAERAGLSKTGLLHHFPDKSSLLAGVLTERTALRRHPDIDADSPGDLLDLFTRTADINHGERDWMRFFTIMVAESLTAEHPAGEVVRTRYATLAEDGRRMLLHSYPWLSDSDALGLAKLVAAVLDGLQIQALLSEDFDLRATWRTFATMCEAYLHALEPVAERV